MCIVILLGHAGFQIRWMHNKHNKPNKHNTHNKHNMHNRQNVGAFSWCQGGQQKHAYGRSTTQLITNTDKAN